MGNGYVFIVEDDIHQQKILDGILASHGYDVKIMGDGLSAWEALKDCETVPDVLLLDIMLPRMDGLQILEKVKEKNCPFPPRIIMQTALGNARQVVDCLRAGASDYMMKPYSTEELLTRVSNHIALRRAQMKHAEAENHLRAIADYTYTWEEWYDASGKLEWVSPAFKRVTGYTVEEAFACKEHPVNVVYPADREKVEKHFTAAIRERTEGKDRRFRVLRKDGEVRWVSVSWQPIYAGNGEYFGTRASIHDIHEQKLAEMELEQYANKMHELAEARARQLVHADRLATLGTLAAGIAHEVRNPCAYISGNVGILRDFWKSIMPCLRDCESSPLSEKQREYYLEEMPLIFKDTIDGVQRIERIVQGLVGYARRDQKAVSQAAHDLHELIESALHLCHNQLKYNIEVIRKFADSSPQVCVSIQRFEQVLVNLFQNAAQAMPDGGRLAVTTEETAGTVRIMVDDSGPGIPEEKLESVWDPFYTTKPEGEGTGLGLSISRSIMEEHGGGMTVEPRGSEGGARFVIELPVAADAGNESE